MCTFITFNIKKSHLSWFVVKPLPPFWESVLHYWCDVHYTHTAGNLALLPLAYNSALARRSTSHAFNPDSITKYEEFGIYSVADFITEFDSLLVRFKKCLDAYAMFKNVTNEWVTMVDSDNYGTVSELEMLVWEQSFAKKCYAILIKLQMPQTNRGHMQWETESKITLMDDWECICNNVTLLVEVKLRSFYLRFINRTYQLNYIHTKYVPGLSENCSFCKQVPETVMHLFWECPKVMSLWPELIHWCEKHISSDVTCSKMNCLLVGFQLPVLNIIMTICKYQIFLLKYYPYSFEFSALLKQINSTCIRDWLSYRELPYLHIGTIIK